MRVTSPTYTIVNEYTGGRLPLFHFDMYRLGSSDELFDIGWEDYLQRGGVCAVEWSENVADAMQGAISVRIGRDSDEQRTIIIEGGGSWHLRPRQRRHPSLCWRATCCLASSI